MSQQAVERWREEALQLEQVASMGVPLAVFLQEVADLLAFAKKYAQPDPKGAYPGLSSVNKLVDTEALTEEIESLLDAARTLHSQVLFPSTTKKAEKELVARCQHLVDELSAALEFILDDDVKDPADEALRIAQARAAEDASRATLAQALSDYTAIAEQVQERLMLLEDFDPTLLEEAKEKSAALIALGSPTQGRTASPEIDLRNRVFTLLKSRVNELRRVARFVFRNHPDIAKLVSSSYERRRRLRNRQQQQQNTPNPTPSPSE